MRPRYGVFPILALSPSLAHLVYERADAQPGPSATYLNPGYAQSIFFPHATGVHDLEIRQGQYNPDSPVTCSQWWCPNGPPGCLTLPQYASMTAAPPSSTTPTTTPLAPDAEPTGPYDPSDCGEKYPSNMNISVYVTNDCSGLAWDIGELQYFDSVPVYEGFRSFKITRTVDEGEVLAFFEYGVAFMDVEANDGAASSAATIPQYYNWLCGKRTGGILNDRDTAWDPSDCWSTPPDGFAQCIQLQRQGICQAERNPPPQVNKTSAPTPAPQHKREAQRWRDDEEVGLEKRVVGNCIMASWAKPCTEGWGTTATWCT